MLSLSFGEAVGTLVTLVFVGVLLLVLPYIFGSLAKKIAGSFVEQKLNMPYGKTGFWQQHNKLTEAFFYSLGILFTLFLFAPYVVVATNIFVPLVNVLATERIALSDPWTVLLAGVLIIWYFGWSLGGFVSTRGYD